jgi:hypothetical protein
MPDLVLERNAAKNAAFLRDRGLVGRVGAVAISGLLGCSLKGNPVEEHAFSEPAPSI